MVTASCHAALILIQSIQGKRKSVLHTQSSLTLDLLVTAHNEERVIISTLTSLDAAAQRLKSVFVGDLALKIIVGTDHCTDRTEALINGFKAQSPITMIENPGQAGKWQMLHKLVAASSAEWVAFVDAGSVWERDLLARIYPLMSDPEVMGIAPSYMPQKAGLLERTNWRLEQRLKRAENGVGGPISIHGASVLYRRAALNEVLSQLTEQSWLNDDVVIPLSLRLRFPRSRIVYFSEGQRRSWVSDVGVRSELDVEYRRRRRMVLGNLQWIRGILLAHLTEGRLSPNRFPIVLISMRRVCRLFWAYWVLLIGFGGLLLLMPLIQSAAGLIAAAGAVVVFGMSSWIRRVSMAFVSGLQIPQYWRELNDKRGVTWS